MNTGDVNPLRGWLTAGFLLLSAAGGLLALSSFPAPAEGLDAVERSTLFVLDEDLDVKIFVHQNRPV
ncbi:hypothetical protein [Zoogloea dura]|jgi:hypothetical protein|uniref:Uncharacterized protein n=1 Tax=Zoogloea dura TaxID=2728840 RepID=A0A848GAW8_9RHOO|nr:hypothetical protein [Zoogloea dura]NML28454.1 hypothetical protein [Zoogloea dura]